MHHAAVAGQDFAGLNPFVFGEVRRNVNVLVIVHGGFGNDKLGNGENDIRQDMPARLESRGGRQVFRVALFHSTFDPLIDRRDIGVAQARVVCKFTDLRIFVPGRHLSLLHVLLNHSREGHNLIVGHERHGRDIVRAMAHHAVLV